MFRKVLCALALSICAVSAWAKPIATISYVEPTGTVGPHDRIDLWIDVVSDVTLSDDESDYFGLDPADLPVFGQAFDDVNHVASTQPFERYDNLRLFASLECMVPCAPSGYTFRGGYGWLTLMTGNDLLHGPVYIGSFEPLAGGVAPGSYTFGVSPKLEFVVTGLSPQGHFLTQIFGEIGACPSANQPACLFTRTVVASVPESQGAILGLAGLACLGALARLRGQWPARRVAR